MARIVFMGTPEFALPLLQALLEEGYHIVTVVTQPDRPAGRSGQPRYGPVKTLALKQGLPLWQPETLRPPQAVEHLRTLAPDVIIVAAYGEILRPAVLSLPPHGCLNVHASLLPRHRGAAPVAAAILAGDAETGATIMQMDEGLDTGPILAQEAVRLTGKERRGELTTRLAEMGAALLQRALPDWLDGKISPQPQDETKATYSRVLRKEAGEIEWSKSADWIERMVRAYDPWPGTYTFLRGRRLRIWQASVLSTREPALPGTIASTGQRLQVATGEGSLLLEEIQLEGKRRLGVEAFLRGQRDLNGVRLGA